MNDPEAKQSIAGALAAFASKPLAASSIALFETLGYISEKRITLKPNTPETFVSTFSKDKPFNPDKALLAEWKSVDFLFQLTDEEVSAATDANQQFVFESKGKWNGAAMESYLFFAITLKKSHYSRTDLSNITRAVNRLFPMPALLVFRHGDTLTLAVINRRLHKRDETKDVLEKVTFIKDIRFADPHRAHVEILFDLSLDVLRGKHDFSNFVELHAAWQQTLDIQTLNKRFFIEIRNWFYWARHFSKFPEGAKKDADGRDSEAIIRLLTRMIFCWFLREKGFIPDTLFATQSVEKLLSSWRADQCDNDKTSRYYKGILQNLFFATLNTPVDERKFRSNRIYQGKNKDYGDQRYFRHVSLFAEKAPVEEIYKAIPFLNGGLFENLDQIPGRDPEVETERRVDGFSDNASKQPIVLDYLFFGPSRSVPDIADVLGESSAPKARGLLSIFRDYKFTIEENTPLEEDIALDPELLGRAFENLLAAVNPETGTVARKSTGSFYTPREIVHYMVEEALFRHLFTFLSSKGKVGNNLEDRLRKVVSEEHEAHDLTDAETNAVIEAIDKLRILDPACGSGAFPMGLLQRLVHVLAKLDKGNEKWKASKLAALPDEMRAKAAKVFAEETFDYTRKLELIKDCIHGVDIQPAAIQISKLRFFLSLVIEQKDAKRIRPLPNLETKFVCANSLLGLPRPLDWELFQHQIEPKEAALLSVRSNYMTAVGKDKDFCETEDRRLRQELAEFIKGIGGSTANQLASAVSDWSPYKPDRVAGYFDPESMFGTRDGFDITIGNPPFVRADEQSQWNQQQRQQILASAQYETLWEKWDLYIPFIERSYKLLRSDGISTLIVSDAFCHSKYAVKAQNWYLTNARILRLDFCGTVKIFEAAVHNIIYFFQKSDGSKWKPERRLHRESFEMVTPLATEEQSKLTHRVFFPEDRSAGSFDCKTIELGTINYISVGMVVHADEKVAKGAFELVDLVADSRDKTHSQRFVEGKHLERWVVRQYKWLEWGTSRAPALFRRPTFPELYAVPEKLFIHRTAGEGLRTAYDTNEAMCNHTVMVCLTWHSLKGVRNKSLKKAARYRGEKVDHGLPNREELEVVSRRFKVKYLLGAMNSSSARNFLRANRRSNTDLYPDDWKKLPIPDVAPQEQEPIIQIVDLLLALLRYFHLHPMEQEARDSECLTFLENINDGLVRELYNPTELHERGIHVAQLVMTARLPSVSSVETPEELKAIRTKLDEAYDIESPLRAALFDLVSLTMSEEAGS